MMHGDNIMALVEMAFAEAFRALNRAIKTAEQSFLKSEGLDCIDLPEIMREAQQAINGDYEQLAMCNQQSAML